MAGGLDVLHEQKRQQAAQVAARRAAEAKVGQGPASNKMGTPGGAAGEQTKGTGPVVKPSTRPELAGVKFASAEARKAAEKSRLTSADLGTGGAKGVTAAEVRAALEKKA